MKNKINKILVCIMAFMLIIAVAPIAVSADETLSVNGVDVKKGDIVTYEYYVSGVADAVEGAGCYIEYDPKFLGYVEGSIGFDVFNNAMFNIGEEDGILYYSAINVVDGYNVKDERLAVTISFKVLDSAKGKTTIAHTFDEFFTIVNEDTDLTAKDYKTREVVKVNEYKENTAPYLGTDADEMNSYIANDSHYTVDDLFTGNPNSAVSTNESSVTSSNNSESTNSATNFTVNSSISPEINSEENSEGTTSSEISESIDEPQSSSVELAEIPVGTDTQPQEESSSNSNAVVIVIIIIVVLLAICAVAYVILKKKEQNKE